MSGEGACVTIGGSFVVCANNGFANCRFTIIITQKHKCQIVNQAYNIIIVLICNLGNTCNTRVQSVVSGEDW